MQELHAALLALQEMDTELARAEARLGEFAPKLEALQAPIVALERELVTTQTKLDEMRAEVQRLEKNAESKQKSRENYLPISISTRKLTKKLSRICIY